MRLPGPEPIPMTGGSRSLPSIEPIPSVNQEGFFLPDHQLESFDSQVDPSQTRLLDQGSSRGNNWRIEEQQLSNGTRLEVGTIEPARRRTDIGLAMGTPWGTQVAGLNLHHGLNAARLGLPVTIVGPEIGQSVSLAESAHNLAAVAAEQGRQGFIDPTHMIYHGYSRPGMFGFAVPLQAKREGISVLFSHITDPCLAIKPSDMSLDDIRDIAQQAPVEVASAIFGIAKMIAHPARRKHYPATIRPTVSGIAQVVRTGIPLFSGEAGILTGHVPPDAKMHVGFFRSSSTNSRREYKRRLAGRPGVTFSDPEGSHITGGEQSTIDHTGRQLSAIILQLRLGVKPQEIDYTLIHEKNAA